MQWFSIRFPQGLAKAFTLSYDDGVVQDRRFIGLLKKYDLRGTFNLNTKRCGQSYIASLNGCRRERLKYEEWKDLYELPYAEAAIHGAEHCHILETPLSALIPEFFEDRRVLEETFGYMVRGGAYPYGDVSDEAIALMRSMGIYYMRTAKSSLSFDPPHGDLMRFDGTCHHDNPKLFELAEKFIGTEPSLNPYLFYVWGTPTSLTKRITGTASSNFSS